MKVCLLCSASSEKSGSGMDAYTWNIISRPLEKTQFLVYPHNRNSIPEWLINEFILPNDSLKLLKTDADVYHAVSQVETKIALLARKSPIITSVHDLIPNSLPKTANYYEIHPKKRRWLNPWYWQFLKKSDHFIASSEKNRNDLIRILKIKPEKISVVFYGNDHQTFHSSYRTDYHNPKNILYLGALDPGRGIYDAIQAFNLVAKRLNDVNLLIGGRGKALYAVTNMVNKLGLKDRVKFLGFVPQEKLSYYYELSDVFFFPSYYGFHLTFLNAMACGLPVIAYAVGYGHEYLGAAGLLVKPGAIHQLAENIVNILSDKEKYVKTSKKAIEQAKLFSWERMAKETMDVYKEILSS